MGQTQHFDPFLPKSKIVKDSQITEPSFVVYWNYKKFGPWLSKFGCFSGYHTHIFVKMYARSPDEEFNTESIGTNLTPKNEKQKSLCALFYLLFLILFWGHFNKTMVFPFFLTIWESVLAEQLPSWNKKNVLELSSKEKF